MNNKTRVLSTIIFVILVLSLNAQSLFEIKDASDNTVLEVSADGLRIFNMGDTLMVISSTEIKAFIDDSAKDNTKGKALSRSFSVSTATSSKGASNVVSIEADGFRVYNAGDKLMDITESNITAYIDENVDNKALSRSFSVSTATSSKEGIDILDVKRDATKMRGNTGKYTDFSENNIFLGANAGISNTNGLSNVFIGNSSGFMNNSGSGNVFLGYQAGYNETTSDKLYIDNSNTSTPLIYGDFVSDELTFNGAIYIPDLLNTVEGSQLKYVYIDQNGQLIASSSFVEEEVIQKSEVELLKQENEKLSKRIDEIEAILNKLNK